MLRVVYEASRELNPGQIVDLYEGRGLVRVKVHPDAEVEQYTRALNAELKPFLEGCSWFQIWRGRVISAASPDSPLTVEYTVDDRLDRRKVVEIRESRGLVKLHVSPRADVDTFVQVLNPAIAKFLAGGQWFQLWEGEIITMDSPPGSLAA